VKNGTGSLPATVLNRLPDNSQMVRLRESDAMLARRRKTTGDPRAARLADITARLVEFIVTVTDLDFRQLRDLGWRVHAAWAQAVVTARISSLVA
jgi:hypothetical protein